MRRVLGCLSTYEGLRLTFFRTLQKKTVLCLNTKTERKLENHRLKKCLIAEKDVGRVGVRLSDALLPPQQKQHEVCQFGVDITTSCLSMYSWFA